MVDTLRNAAVNRLNLANVTVTSLNGLRGEVSITGGNGIDVSPSTGDVVVSVTSPTVTSNSETFFTAQQNFAPVQIYSGDGLLSWDLNSQQTAFISLTENTFIANPNNIAPMGTYILIIQQSFDSNYTISWSDAYFPPTGQSMPQIDAVTGCNLVVTFIADFSGAAMMAVSTQFPQVGGF